MYECLKCGNRQTEGNVCENCGGTDFEVYEKRN